MRNNKRSNQNSPEVRSLKIQPKTRFNTDSKKDVPEIKLSGVWLQNLGFQHGGRVTITTLQNLLIIQPSE
jgi:hypothetical protein